MTEDSRRHEFVCLLSDLARKPFPERYVAYRRFRPRPYEAPPHGRISNEENLALILVMSANFSLFGVKRMGAILRWPNIQVHHILQHGLVGGHVKRASATMYQASDIPALVSRITQAPQKPDTNPEPR